MNAKEKKQAKQKLAEWAALYKTPAGREGPALARVREARRATDGEVMNKAAPILSANVGGLKPGTEYMTTLLTNNGGGVLYVAVTTTEETPPLSAFVDEFGNPHPMSAAI